MALHNEVGPLSRGGSDDNIHTTPATTTEASTAQSSGDMVVSAIEYARHNWPVFRLRGKVPAIGNPHPKDSPEYTSCKGECGQLGHRPPRLDATTDRPVVSVPQRSRHARRARAAARPAAGDAHRLLGAW